MEALHGVYKDGGFTVSALHLLLCFVLELRIYLSVLGTLH